MDDNANPSSAIYRIELEPVQGRVAAIVDGQTVADSSEAVKMLETHLPPVIYFPHADVDAGVLQRSDQRTFCPFRESVTHWALRLPSRTIDDAAWSYDGRSRSRVRSAATSPFTPALLSAGSPSPASSMGPPSRT